MTTQRDFWSRSLPPTPERSLHIALADRLRLQCRPDWYWTSIESGAYRPKQTAALLQRQGVQPGVPDMLLIAPSGLHAWLELKRKGGRLSEPQARFEIMCHERSIPHCVAYSYDEAIAQLKQWGAL